MSHAHKVVLITGASSGIGAATAKLFAKEQAHLSLVGRNENNLHEVAQVCRQTKGVKVLPIVADVDSDEDVKRIVRETIDTFGRLDVLVNNAGFGSIATLDDGVDIYDRIFATNVRAVYLLTSLAKPYLVESKGNIVNVSSVGGLKPLKNLMVYCMSKAALDMFTRGSALELAEYGIRVNSVSPGTTKSDFLSPLGMDTVAQEKFYARAARSLPLKKCVTSEEVGEQILHLAGEKSRSITGSTITIDNGLLLQLPALFED